MMIVVVNYRGTFFSWLYIDSQYTKKIIRFGFNIFNSFAIWAPRVRIIQAFSKFSAFSVDIFDRNSCWDSSWLSFTFRIARKLVWWSWSFLTFRVWFFCTSLRNFYLSVSIYWLHNFFNVRLRSCEKERRELKINCECNAENKKYAADTKEIALQIKYAALTNFQVQILSA